MLESNQFVELLLCFGHLYSKPVGGSSAAKLLNRHGWKQHAASFRRIQNMKITKTNDAMLLCQTLAELRTVYTDVPLHSRQSQSHGDSQVSEFASRGVFVQMNSTVGRLTLIAYTSSCQASNGFPGLKGTQVTNYSLWQAKPSETQSSSLLVMRSLKRFWLIGGPAELHSCGLL